MNLPDLERAAPRPRTPCATAGALLLGLVLTAPATAREFQGVQVPETATVAGKTLKLDGVGLRRKLIFRVYVAALYLETPSSDAEQVLASDQAKHVEMTMLRDLDRGAIVEAVREGFQRNAGPQMPALSQRLDRFVAAIPDLHQGERLSITYLPGKGTSVATSNPPGAGDQSVTVEGKDFADALFSVWIGKFPVNEDLKKGMLGQ